MKKYFSKTPRFMMRFFSKYTWHFQSNEKEIFLTFDDGPTPEITQFVLSELKKFIIHYLRVIQKLTTN